MRSNLFHFDNILEKESSMMRKSQRQLPGFRPALEQIEKRTLLSSFTVTKEQDDGKSGSLRYAIAQAYLQSPDEDNTIVFADGVKTVTELTDLLIPIQGNVTIASVTIVGANFDVYSNSVLNLKDTTLTDGGLTSFFTATLNCENDVLNNSRIVNISGAVTVTDSTIINVAAGTTAVSCLGGSATLTHDTIKNNAGPLIETNVTQLVIDTCQITGNSNSGGAPAISISQGWTTISNSDIDGNTASTLFYGFLSTRESLDVVNTHIDSNTVTTAVVQDDNDGSGQMNLNGVSISQNQSLLPDAPASALTVTGSPGAVTLTDSNIINNGTYGVGPINNNNTVNLDNSVVDSNLPGNILPGGGGTILVNPSNDGANSNPSPDPAPVQTSPSSGGGGSTVVSSGPYLNGKEKVVRLGRSVPKFRYQKVRGHTKIVVQISNSSQKKGDPRIDAIEVALRDVYVNGRLFRRGTKFVFTGAPGESAEVINSLEHNPVSQAAFAPLSA